MWQRYHIELVSSQTKKIKKFEIFFGCLLAKEFPAGAGEWPPQLTRIHREKLAASTRGNFDERLFPQRRGLGFSRRTGRTPYHNPGRQNLGRRRRSGMKDSV